MSLTTFQGIRADRATFVLYHANCPDGFGAAWAAWMHLGDAARYIPVSYQQPLPDIPNGSDVFIVDFSYPREVLTALAARAEIAVIDHHHTAEKELADLPFATFDQKKSGAVLTWEHFSPTRDVPDMLLYLQDRDLWQWKLPNSKAINAGLWRGTERDFGVWKNIAALWNAGVTPGRVRLLEAGEAIAFSDSLTVDQLCRKPDTIRVLSYDVPAVNSPVLQSEIGHELLKRHPHAPFVAIYWLLDNGSPTYSLRARTDDFDVSAVAKEFGGGGHRAAAGFQVPELFPFVGAKMEGRANG